ncbi:MAG: guanylate kinase [Deltaproteobacteria bacterium]|jgi:guanylate kinase|nr:guanylate kinase [Deltaproteobacteria bacterium]
MTGSLFVISAPSGAGKTSIIQAVFRRRKCPRLDYSVSYTTRPPRPGEENGRDYNFTDPDTFRNMIQKDGFLEWTENFSRYYGTGREWILDRLQKERDVLVDVDVVGAQSMRKHYPESILIFLVPPTFEELTRRLNSRRTEDSEEVRRRLDQAAWEISQRGIFDYLIINDRLDQAVEDAEKIFLNRQGRPMAAQENFWPRFFQKPENLP